MSDIILPDVKKNPKIPDLSPGDSVKVGTRVVEGGKERTQLFQGVVIRIRSGSNASFTVRHVAYGVGVERTFPYASPVIDRVEVARRGKVRRARLYYLRRLSGKASRIKEKREEKAIEQPAAQVVEKPIEPPAASKPVEQPVEKPAEPAA